MKEKEIQYYLEKDHGEDIKKAHENLKPILKETSLIFSDALSKEHGCNIYIKPENLQLTGSFKIRGAYNKICNLDDDELKSGVIASSAGNHAQGVAFSASERRIKSTIVMPNITPLLKLNATKGFGAEVVQYGDVYDESYNKAMELAEEHGYVFVHPFDDYDVICGQGTIGIEILEDLDDVDEILVPIGGGGPISGIAAYVKAVKPQVKIIGVSPAGAQSMKISIDEGHVTRLATVKTNAEGVAVKQPGDLTYAFAREYVDEIVSVSEKEIMESLLFILEQHKLVAEAAGVVSLAGIKKRAQAGKNIVPIISGGNIDTVTISSIINQGMISRGRIMCFTVELPDRPGQLVKVASILAENGANVIELQHDQFKAVDRYANNVLLEVTVETNGHSHIQQITEIMEENDFHINRIY